MLYQLYNPPVFQGNLKKKNYFEGWYFKHVSYDLKNVISFIPGISLNDNFSHAFIQVLDGVTGNSEYFTYPLSEFKWDKRKMFVKVGNSVFTDRFISLDIHEGRRKIIGRIDYSNIVKYPKSLLSPGIMGWYSFVPFMECKHGIVSVNHDLSGIIYLNDSPAVFDKGKGYIEKDWGTSFPECWAWLQANNFNDHNTSLSFSVAKIPWRGRFFIGFICFLYFDGKFIVFSTYKNSKITEIRNTRKSIVLTLINQDYTLKINCIKGSPGDLRAPVSGNMSRGIKESIDATVRVVLYNKENKIIYTDSSRRGGVEVIEKIFDYFSQYEKENCSEGKKEEPVPAAYKIRIPEL
ncbi:MAG TPA: tocopherol cyclase family protein [Bacteroidales bacterium]|nr:tocopherol cyclase family protein [Bacteroidales bacterium]